MTALFRQNLVEAVVGAAVLVVAAAFVVFFYQRTSGSLGSDRYAVAALFSNATGVAVGTDVRVSGIKVGSVTAETLDPQTFQARLMLSIDRRIALPLDSSAAIASEGILGGSYVQITPGAETDMLTDGDEILDTQGSVDLMGLIGSFINKSGDTSQPTAAPAGAGAGPGGQ
jgi:phospholipid/cholesterol/gamma-HCH transport system substrate-binding protein